MTNTPDTSVRLTTALVEGPIPRTSLIEGIGMGGICAFTGTTRPETHPEFGPLRHLAYRVAEPLTSTRLMKLAESIAQRYELLELHVRHAVGDVPVGLDSVRIEAASRHRAAAFEACRETIDRLKAEIPIWKKECWSVGETWSSNSTPLESPA